MRHASPLFLIGAALVLGGCVAAPPPAPPSVCEEGSANAFAGQQATPAVQEAARIAASAQTVRVVRPDQAITMEFNAARLTLNVDRGNIITRGHCG